MKGGGGVDDAGAPGAEKRRGAEGAEGRGGQDFDFSFHGVVRFAILDLRFTLLSICDGGRKWREPFRLAASGFRHMTQS